LKIAYFDCPTGFSGNMILASLLDAGLKIETLKHELKKLKMSGYQLKMTKVIKKGMAAKYLDVIVTSHEHRTIHDIYKLIDKSRLSSKIKSTSKRIFERLYAAEVKVHGGGAHLHEVSGTDAIVDIVGSVIAFDKMGIAEIYCSPVPFGHGRIEHSHGYLPNPAPATSQLLKGATIYRKDIKGELVTPTGAAIMTTLAKSFDDMPRLKIDKMGLGAGFFDLTEANILRIFIGETASNFEQDLVVAIETNIDNMNPELYSHVINRLMHSGALDAYITNISMKKGRPGVLLTVLSPVDDKNRLIDRIFDETTTLGVRTYLIRREKLTRTIDKVRTKYGIVRVKTGKTGDTIKNIAPEYEDCARLSLKNRVPLKSVYDAAIAALSLKYN
jgi:pyridinium-3,5-bisthiocarboxylic acid mononucleotide nickel chelatase